MPNLAANTTYYLFVDGNSGSLGNIGFRISSWPLAIRLVDLSAMNAGTRNRINWTTGEEVRGDYFILERSADGINYSALATIDAKGTPSTYSYWDETPASGINHYRLKMMDAAGNFTYSKVVTATVKGGAFTVEVYPNPVSDVLTVKVFGSSASNPTVSISDAIGRVVKVVTVVNNEAKIDMSPLAHGMYLVKYSDNNHVQTIKVYKQ
jgi:hypothetical protein